MLVVANLVDLSAIASVGSAVALVIFLLVGAAGYRRRADTGSNTVIVVLAIAVTAIVLGFFAVDTAQNAPETFGRDHRASGCCRSSSTRSSDADDPTGDRQTDATAEPRHRRPAERSAAAIAGYMRAASWNRQRRDRRHPGAWEQRAGDARGCLAASVLATASRLGTAAAVPPRDRGRPTRRPGRRARSTRAARTRAGT